MEVIREVAPGISRPEVQRIIRTAVRMAGGRVRDAAVIFTTDAAVRRLNRTFRKRDRTTDVLSFPSGAAFPGPGQGIGEIVISVPEARRLARRRRIPLRDELRLLLVHGALHCLGHDHETMRDARRMYPLQARILVKLGVPAARARTLSLLEILS